MTNTDTESVPRFLDELRKAVLDTSTRLLIMSRGDPVIRQGLFLFPNHSEYNIMPDDVGPELMVYYTLHKLSAQGYPTKTNQQGFP